MLYLSRINEYNYNYCNIPAVILTNVADNIYDRNDIWQIYGSTQHIKGVEMNWTEICKKYNTDEFRKFIKGYFDDFDFDTVLYMPEIWGYLLVFAETKGWHIGLDYLTGINKYFAVLWQGEDIEDTEEVIEDKSIEHTMALIADKFFEVAK